ncbi:MAG: DUF1801 domain-containing protein [Bacteroidia bacterium]
MKTIPAYIKEQEASRRNLLQSIHDIIIKADKNVVPAVAGMMGKEMIMYNCGGTMKYALSSVKTHMSLHLMPIYGSSPLHEKYSKLLPHAKFQKGCINFKKADELSLPVVQSLLTDCAKVDLLALLQKMKTKKK